MEDHESPSRVLSLVARIVICTASVLFIMAAAIYLFTVGMLAAVLPGTYEASQVQGSLIDIVRLSLLSCVCIMVAVLGFCAARGSIKRAYYIDAAVALTVFLLFAGFSSHEAAFSHQVIDRMSQLLCLLSIAVACAGFLLMRAQGEQTPIFGPGAASADDEDSEDEAAGGDKTEGEGAESNEEEGGEAEGDESERDEAEDEEAEDGEAGGDEEPADNESVSESDADADEEASDEPGEDESAEDEEGHAEPIEDELLEDEAAEDEASSETEDSDEGEPLEDEVSEPDAGSESSAEIESGEPTLDEVPDASEGPTDDEPDESEGAII